MDYPTCVGVRVRTVGKSREAADGSNILLRIAAGITTGAIALSVAQPTDLVKIRMQSARGRYEGCLHAYRTIVRDEGVRGLWKGLSVAVRSSITIVLNSTQFIKYNCSPKAGLKK